MSVSPARKEFLLMVAERQPELRDYIEEEFGVEYPRENAETREPEDLFCGSPLLSSRDENDEYAITCDLLEEHDGPHAWRDNALPHKQGEIVVWWSGGREQDRAVPNVGDALDAAAAEVWAFAQAHGYGGA